MSCRDCVARRGGRTSRSVRPEGCCFAAKPARPANLTHAGAGARFFAPAMRNMRDREVSVSRMAEFIDVLCCNRHEWESLEDREQVAWLVSILAVTDGPNGCVVRFTTPEGEPERVSLPSFPRTHPPRDTNRAGETFAATLLTTLLDGGWSPRPGVAEPELVKRAALRASASAALVLDRAGFGFPSDQEIDEALRNGRVGAIEGGE